MTDVFISYSRKDADFARRLTNQLISLQRDVWVDWQDIPRGSNWLNEIYAGIEAADAFLLVVSQHSLTSEVCNQEIAHARRLNKRIIPLIRGRIEGDTEKIVKGTWVDTPWNDIARDNWDAIRHINWLFFDDDSRFDAEFPALLDVLAEDLTHRKTHTRYLVRALDWDRGARNPSFLLIGDEIAAAERWLVESVGKQPPPDPLHTAYIEASRRADDDRHTQLARLETGRQRFRFAAGVLGLLTVIAAAAGVLLAAQGSDARNLALTATHAQGHAIAAGSTSAAEANIAGTEVALAGATLSPIPPTLTAVADEIILGQNRIESLRLASLINDELQLEQPDFYAATLLGIRALNTTYTAQAEAGLVRAAQQNAAFDGHSLSRLTGPVRTLAYSFDGRLIVTTNNDLTAVIWDVASGKIKHTLSGHQSTVTLAIFSPDGKSILTISNDETGKIWDADSGELRHTLIGHVRFIQSVLYSPDGQTIITRGDDDVAIIWDAATGENLQTIQLTNPPSMTENAGETNRFSLIDNSYGIMVKDNVSDKILYPLYPRPNSPYSPDGQSFLAINTDNTVSIFDFTSDEPTHILTGHTKIITSADYSPDGNLILTTSLDNTARIWDASSGEQVQVLTGYIGITEHSSLSSDANSFITWDKMGQVVIWNINAKPVLRVLEHDDRVIDANFSPDGRFIMTQTWSGGTVIWNADNGEALYSLDGRDGNVRSAAFSPDGQFIATTGYGGVNIWDAATGELMQSLTDDDSFGQTIAYSPDGKFIASVSGGSIVIFEIATGDIVQSFFAHVDVVTNLTYSPDGRFLLSASFDHSVVAWDVITGEAAFTLLAERGIMLDAIYSPDGDFIVTHDQTHVATIRDSVTGDPVKTLTAHRASIFSIAYSPDGQHLITTGADKTAVIWDLETGVPVRTLSGHNAVVSAATYSPDGRFIITGADDNRAIIWDADYRTFVDNLCERLRFMRDFTDEERISFGIFDDEPTCPQFATPPTPS